jgi:uncharacterized protein YbbK (DUF523 family)
VSRDGAVTHEPRAERPSLLVSACLLGLCTRFDGGHNRDEAVRGLGARFTLVPICPEQLGGLPTPRPAAEIQGPPREADARAGDMRVEDARVGDVREADVQVVVRTRDGLDVSGKFRRGGEAAVTVARLVGARSAVLKSRSPSCGVGETYDGTFSHTVRAGSGVTADMLRRAGLDLYTEEHVAAGRTPS